MEYIILTAESAESLVTKVERYIKGGWIPQGGVAASVSVNQGYTSSTWAQAMIKITPTKE